MSKYASAVVTVVPGADVWFEGTCYTVKTLFDLKNVLARSHEDGKSYRLQIQALKASREESLVPNPISLIDIPEKEWRAAQKRFDVIKPLLETPKFHRTISQVQARADESNVSLATIYRWLDQYESSGLMSALIRSKRSDLGRSRIDPRVEQIISDVITEEFLSEQRVKVVRVVEEVASRCRKENLQAPHLLTVRRRINALPEAMRHKKRHGRHMAKGYEPLRGHFPGADWPLAYVQIDHTPLDIILVDDIHRQPVGKPFITLALDVFSRMITGFYLSFDNPSCFTVGMCIAHSVLPKEHFLRDFDIASEWPVYGKMRTIHVDNALEFRSDILKRACDQHQINLEWRPVREPQYGGHVERIFRTISTKVHELPGTTFSSIEEREKYQSEKYSAFTLSEFECWLTTFIVDKYHQSFHTEINMSPVKKYEQGILGDSKAGIIGSGMPPRIVDDERFRIDFMPHVKRTIQNYGMRNNKIYYFHDVLRPWINAREEGSRGKRRRFIFHYDPRDISKFYFWDPEIKQYFTIPYRDTTHPPISHWELNEANKLARREGRALINEDVLFDAYERMKSITKEAVRKTDSERKRQRREEQRKRDHQRQKAREKVTKTVKIDEPDPFEDLDFDDVEAFSIDEDF